MRSRRDRRSLVTQRDYLFGPQNIAAPDKAPFDPIHDPPIVLLTLRRLISNHPVDSQIDEFLGLHLGHFQAMKHLDQAMNGVCQILSPPLQSLRFPLFRCGLKLGSKSSEIIEDSDKITNERLLQ